jgi:hypothetical protein
MKKNIAFFFDHFFDQKNLVEIKKYEQTGVAKQAGGRSFDPRQ